MGPAPDLSTLSSLYKKDEAQPSDIISAIYDCIEAGPLTPVWISLVPRDAAIAHAKRLEADASARSKPLYGAPFAIKDNIDLEGRPTTAACPAYAYQPACSATVVQALIEAGAIPIGKTNLDQFATGLVGTRSPYGACSSVFGDSYISGGSSSGSAVAVARGLVSFSLGSDTAGSGRVPAAFNNLVGLKPTRGLLSTSGLVPACRSLDCISVFARTCSDARAVWRTARGFDAADPSSRSAEPGSGATPWTSGPFRFGIPADEELEFFGDTEAAAMYRNAIANLESLGGEAVEIRYAPFREAAQLLYKGPWVAERLAAIGPFMNGHREEMNPVVRKIISGAARFSAADVWLAEYRLRELQRETETEWRRMDVLVLPTAGTIYTHEEIAADPVRLNSNLGYYTNFVNLLDLAAVAVPAGFRSDGLPFGISVIGPAFTDEALLGLADRFHRAQAPPPGSPLQLDPTPNGCVLLAVVGAHLEGQPLNWQLKERRARRVRTCRTAAGYRLYALEGTVPAKPGLVWDPGFNGSGIEVEVWAVPENEFGGFVAGVPSPLTIGSALLEDGARVSCFLAEPFAIRGAREITEFGGWREFLASAHQAHQSAP